jgi:VWFA-related protein
MKRFRSTVVAAAILVTFAAPVAESVAAQGLVTWLVFVDDLHLDFRNTGRLRDLLRLVSSELIRNDDRFAVRSSGPSMLSVDITQDRTLLASAIKRTNGSGLGVSDIERGGRNEAWHRATVALATARAAIGVLGQAPAGRRGLIYVSNGYQGDDPLRDQVQEVARFAQETGVTIFAVDPRGLPGAIVDDPRVDPLVWKDYLTTTRETLRMLSQPTGGFVLFETADLSQALNGIGAAMRK